MEVSSTSNSILSITTISNNVNKRKNTLIETDDNKRFKSKTLVPVMNKNNDNAIHNERNSDLREKIELNKRPSTRGLKYLSNLKESISLSELSISDFTFHSLTEQLRVLNLRKIKIIADGNCFFRAISHQLFGNQTYHRELRYYAITY
ncbi:unnamed protein product, partial [Rotaria sp. Silwood2]